MKARKSFIVLANKDKGGEQKDSLLQVSNPSEATHPQKTKSLHRRLRVTKYNLHSNSWYDVVFILELSKEINISIYILLPSSNFSTTMGYTLKSYITSINSKLSISLTKGRFLDSKCSFKYKRKTLKL